MSRVCITLCCVSTGTGMYLFCLICLLVVVGVIGGNLEAQSTYVFTYVHIMKNPKIIFLVYILCQ